MTRRASKDAVYVKFEMGFPAQTERIVEALRRAARGEQDPETKKKLRRMAQKIVAETSFPRVYHKRVERPWSDDEWALQRVIDGDPPYPVLSQPDAQRAFLVLRSQHVSLKEIGYRLHINPRTVSRWVVYFKEGTWQVRS